MKRAGLLLLGALLYGGVAVAEDWEAQVWASTCFACHGPEGRSEGGMPALKGLSAEAIHESMLQFRSGVRRATVMDRHAKGYTEEQIRRIADALGRNGGAQ